MKIISYLLVCSFYLCACNNGEKSVVEVPKKDSTSFFPVTDYLQGEIYNIKKSGINPLKYTTVNDHTDSVWLKIEALDSAMEEFITPVIDSANLSTLFSGNSFLDQSLGAVTFTYDSIKSLPDSMKLRHWDIYIDPKSNKVKRVYIVKQPDKNKTLQLTWLSGRWCKITTIVADEKGVLKVEKEEKFTWDF